MTDESNIEQYRKELIGYLKECYDFSNGEDSIDILKKLSAFSARASWLRNSIVRSPVQKFIRFRIDELDPFIAEIDRQFKIWSRIGSMEQFEWEKSTKG